MFMFIDFLFYSYLVVCIFFFFKQKTAYEMRISDWSSDVCSSDLATHHAPSMLSIPTEHKEHLLSAAYASDLEQFIITHQPDLWVHEIGRASCRERVCQYV